MDTDELSKQLNATKATDAENTRLQQEQAERDQSKKETERLFSPDRIETEANRILADLLSRLNTEKRKAGSVVFVTDIRYLKVQGCYYRTDYEKDMDPADARVYQMLEEAYPSSGWMPFLDKWCFADRCYSFDGECFCSRYVIAIKYRPN